MDISKTRTLLSDNVKLKDILQILSTSLSKNIHKGINSESALFIAVTFMEIFQKFSSATFLHVSPILHEWHSSYKNKTDLK